MTAAALVGLPLLVQGTQFHISHFYRLLNCAISTCMDFQCERIELACSLFLAFSILAKWDCKDIQF